MISHYHYDRNMTANPNRLHASLIPNISDPQVFITFILQVITIWEIGKAGYEAHLYIIEGSITDRIWRCMGFLGFKIPRNPIILRDISAFLDFRRFLWITICSTLSYHRKDDHMHYLHTEYCFGKVNGGGGGG